MLTPITFCWLLRLNLRTIWNVNSEVNGSKSAIAKATKDFENKNQRNWKTPRFDNSSASFSADALPEVLASQNVGPATTATAVFLLCLPPSKHGLCLQHTALVHWAQPAKEHSNDLQGTLMTPLWDLLELGRVSWPDNKRSAVLFMSNLFAKARCTHAFWCQLRASVSSIFKSITGFDRHHFFSCCVFPEHIAIFLHQMSGLHHNF